MNAVQRAAMHVAWTSLDDAAGVSEATLTAIYALLEACDVPAEEQATWGGSVVATDGRFYVPSAARLPTEPRDAEPEPFDPR